MNNEHVAAYPALADRLQKRNVNVKEIKARLKEQHIETPSWGYGNSGTRFKVFSWPGAARDIHEKLADAGYIHKLTGIAPSVALHIPWDKTNDYKALRDEAHSHGVEIGAINPNLFQDAEYKLGSICHPSPGVQETAIAHMVECC